MKNLTTVLLAESEAEPLSTNRRLQELMKLSTLDLPQLGMLTGVPWPRLDGYFSGEVDLLQPELSALARTLRDTLHENNRRLERVLAGRPVRKIRARRSPEATAASLEKARRARAAKRLSVAVADGIGGGDDLAPPASAQSEAVCG